MNDKTCAACGSTLAARHARGRSRPLRARAAEYGRRPWRDFRVDPAPSRGYASLFRIRG